MDKPFSLHKIKKWDWPIGYRVFLRVSNQNMKMIHNTGSIAKCGHAWQWETWSWTTLREVNLTLSLIFCTQGNGHWGENPVNPGHWRTRSGKNINNENDYTLPCIYGWSIGNKGKNSRETSSGSKKQLHSLWYIIL